jgi:hypothetical protein
MIIGEKFVWLHFPKCAGSEIEGILRKNYGGQKGIEFDKIDYKNVVWHQNIDDRERTEASFKLGERDVISAIRRLPYWLLSRIHFEKARSPEAVVTREMFLEGRFYEAPRLALSADHYVRKYTSRPVAHWIRTEFLAEDFRRVFGQYLNLDHINLESAFVQKNRNPLRYVADLAFYFKPEELQGLYNANPRWRDLEMELYGDILRL